MIGEGGISCVMEEFVSICGGGEDFCFLGLAVLFFFGFPSSVISFSPCSTAGTLLLSISCSFFRRAKRTWDDEKLRS